MPFALEQELVNQSNEVWLFQRVADVSQIAALGQAQKVVGSGVRVMMNVQSLIGQTTHNRVVVGVVVVKKRFRRKTADEKITTTTTAENGDTGIGISET